MKHIIVLGGGIGGLSAARALSASAMVSVTLVDRKDYFEVTYAQLRALVDPERTGLLSRIPYSQIFPGGFVHGEVQRVEDGAVVLADGAHLSFDFLVLAPGTRYPRFSIAKPTTQLRLADRNAHNRAEFERFRAAKGYLVLGGGAVGVELAGELASAAKGKTVRLAHRGPRLMEGMAPRASALALRHLTSLGVEVSLNSGIASPLPGELVYEAVSPEVATDWLPSEILDGRGRIRVEPTLQVSGRPAWYAIGDASAAPDPKHGANAAAQGEYVAAQILTMLASPDRNIKPYRSGRLVAVVPIGRSHGVAQLPIGVVAWKFIINLKRRDFFVGRYRRELKARI